MFPEHKVCQKYHSGEAIWRDIWKRTLEKSLTNVTNVTMPLLSEEPWRDIWKFILENKHTNATSVNMHHCTLIILRGIWKLTPRRNITNAISAILHLLGQTVWGNISKVIVEKKHTSAITNAIMHLFRYAIRGGTRKIIDPIGISWLELWTIALPQFWEFWRIKWSRDT